MPAPKTMNVDTYRIKINNMIRMSTCSKDVRQGMISAIEVMLYATGNYRGFRYLEQTEVPEGHLPGIIRKGTPDIMSKHSGLQYESSNNGKLAYNIFPDNTRVEYYSNN